jgi:hypothetical protein
MTRSKMYHIEELDLNQGSSSQKIVFASLQDLEQAHAEINDGKDIYVVLGQEIVKLLNQELSSKVYDGRIKLAAKYADNETTEV